MGATIKLVESFIQEAKQEVSFLLKGIRRRLFLLLQKKISYETWKNIFQLIYAEAHSNHTRKYSMVTVKNKISN